MHYFAREIRRSTTYGSNMASPGGAVSEVGAMQQTHGCMASAAGSTFSGRKRTFRFRLIDFGGARQKKRRKRVGAKGNSPFESPFSSKSPLLLLPPLVEEEVCR